MTRGSKPSFSDRRQSPVGKIRLICINLKNHPQPRDPALLIVWCISFPFFPPTCIQYFTEPKPLLVLSYTITSWAPRTLSIALWYTIGCKTIQWQRNRHRCAITLTKHSTTHLNVIGVTSYYVITYIMHTAFHLPLHHENVLVSRRIIWKCHLQ